MKNLLFSAIFLVFCHCLNAQLTNDNYIEFAFSDNIPKHLPDGLKKHDSLRCARFVTGVDSIELTIGSLYRNEHKLYLAHLKKGKSSVSTMFNLEKNDSTRLFSFDLEFDIVPYTNMIAFRVLSDPATGKFYFTWLNGSKTSDSFVIQDKNTPIKLNKSMPAFTVETLNREEVNSMDLLGSWVVINWWATSCAPCIKEMPGLNKLVDKHQANENIKFIAIAQDERDRWQNFLQKKKFDYDQTLSNDATKTIFGDSYPKNIILNPDGIVKYYSEGGWENMYLEIDEALVNLTTK